MVRLHSTDDAEKAQNRMVKECIMDILQHSEIQKHKSAQTLSMISRLLSALPLGVPPAAFELASSLRENLVKLKKVCTVASYVGQLG